MATYMIQGSYTAEAWAAMARNPEDRGIALGKLLESFGGRLHNIYYTFGDHDVVAMIEVPDDTTAMATLLAAVSAGHLKATKTTKLLSTQEAMAAMSKAGKQVYAAPKG